MASASPDEKSTGSGPPAVAPRAFAGVKPRPKLFLVLCILFAGWIGVLIWLYVRTVYPVRYPARSASEKVQRQAEN